MRPLLAMLIAFAASAHAQYGVGIAPSAQCPYGYQPGAGSMNGRDEVVNLQGRYDVARQQLDQIENELGTYDEKIERARGDMRRVLPGTAITSIEDHRTFKRGYYDYYDCPQNPGAVASASGGNVTATLPKRGGGSNPGGSANGTTPVYPPDDFCYRPRGGKTVNTWAELANDKGTISDQVCNYNIPSFQGAPNPQASQECREGLRDYYNYVGRREALQAKRAQLDAECRSLERKVSRLEEEIAEGRYCPYCGIERRGYSQSSVTQSISPMVGMLALVGVSLFNQQNRPQFGAPPPQLGGPRMPSFPGPGAYPGNPYPAVTPGYMGVQNGVYGALPGGIGRGAFGCGGTNPMYGNPYAQGQQPFLNSTSNPFGNPYANPMANPALQNSVFNPGYGPGFGPVLGNGVNGYNPYGNPYSPFQQGNPFSNLMASGQNPFGVNPYGLNNPYGSSLYGGAASTVLPFQGNPYFQNQYQYGVNPYGINPYGGGNPYGNNLYGAAPGVLPFPGPYGGNAFAANPYAYGGGLVNPYASGNPYGGGVAYGNPYGAYNNASLGNLYYQMEQMKRTMVGIQNSPVYGGNSPAVLPYPGPSYGYGYSGGGYGGGYAYRGGYGLGGNYNFSPIYNTPGTNLNPLPLPPRPAPLPIPPPISTPTGPGGIIRSR
ncbi:MAG: hypothetical protein KF799_12925 [Bdellovibrionales bacterium]|nr:hypothetical protein [Bdellovibrionales bacterium]